MYYNYIIIYYNCINYDYGNYDIIITIIAISLFRDINKQN